MTPLFLTLALLWVPRPGRVDHIVVVGTPGWYNVRTANARVGRYRGPVLRFQTVKGVTVVVTREPEK